MKMIQPCNFFLIHSSDHGGILYNETLDSMQILDEFKMSWLGWEYKTYIRKTGWNEGLFEEETGKIRPKLARLYSRPYAMAVAGTIVDMKYDDHSHVFILKWIIAANSSSDVVSEIFLSRKWHYPTGYRVSFSSSASIRTRTSGNVLYVSAKSRKYDQVVELIVRPI